MCRASLPKVKSRYQVLAPPPRHHPADSAAGGAMAGATKVSRPCLLSAVVVAGQARVPPTPPAYSTSSGSQTCPPPQGTRRRRRKWSYVPSGAGPGCAGGHPVVTQWSSSGHPWSSVVIQWSSSGHPVVIQWSPSGHPVVISGRQWSSVVISGRHVILRAQWGRVRLHGSGGNQWSSVEPVAITCSYEPSGAAPVITDRSKQPRGGRGQS